MSIEKNNVLLYPENIFYLTYKLIDDSGIEMNRPNIGEVSRIVRGKITAFMKRMGSEYMVFTSQKKKIINQMIYDTCLGYITSKMPKKGILKNNGNGKTKKKVSVRGVSKDRRGKGEEEDGRQRKRVSVDDTTAKSNILKGAQNYFSGVKQEQSLFDFDFDNPIVGDKAARDRKKDKVKGKKSRKRDDSDDEEENKGNRKRTQEESETEDEIRHGGDDDDAVSVVSVAETVDDSEADYDFRHGEGKGAKTIDLDTYKGDKGDGSSGKSGRKNIRRQMDMMD